ncbi:SIMPL domain-containing protein [Candidatus Woesearchaeota archaeon]|nr:SIMPL domain-containing protein [Candidatus Woesearchaeota archaeon]
METKNYLTTVLAVGLIIVALLLALNSKSNVIAGQNGLQKNTVSVSGTSSLTVDPNKAEVYVKIATLEKTASESKNKNSQISGNVIKALKKEGVKDKDIETSQFYIAPKYDYEEVIEGNLRKSKQILVGYEVTNVLKVTTQDLDKAGKLIDAAVDNGANDIERVTFGLTKEKEKDVKQQAMVMASNDAKDKAVALATNLEVSLLKPISISEASFYYQPFEFPRGALLEKAAASDTVINPQKLDVSASVNLVYEIK